MATIEEILAGTDTRFYDGRDQTFNPNNILQSGFGQGANTNFSGILGTEQAQDTLSSNPIFASPRAMGAEDIGIPERRGILDFLKAGGAKVRDTLLQGAGATGGLNIGARLGMLVNPALAIPGALLGAFFGSKVTEMGPSGSFYAGLTDEQKEAVDEIYGPGGIMQGYNPISMFGRGAAGAIDKRRAGIMRALEKRESEELQQRLDDLQAARDRITGTIRDASGRITGGTGQGTIDSGNEGGYGGTGGEGPSAVSSSGMLGGGV